MAIVRVETESQEQVSERISNRTDEAVRNYRAIMRVWFNGSSNDMIEKMADLHREALESNSHNHDTSRRRVLVLGQVVRIPLPPKRY